MIDDSKQVITDFKAAVNMTAKQIESWLESADSKKVGFKKSEAGESVGHESGRHIIRILNKKRAEYDESDLKHMVKVVGYIHRHLAQRPTGDIEETPWRQSLMNWGHDPSKKSKTPRKSQAKSSA